MKECDIWGAKCYSDPFYIFVGRSIPQPLGSTPVSVSRITRKQCCGLEFILSRSGSRSRDLMAKVSVLVSRPKKVLTTTLSKSCRRTLGEIFVTSNNPFDFGAGLQYRDPDRGIFKKNFHHCRTVHIVRILRVECYLGGSLSSTNAFLFAYLKWTGAVLAENCGGGAGLAPGRRRLSSARKHNCAITDGVHWMRRQRWR